MDLYRTLRISLYLLAGTGAFSIAVAERSFFYLALIAALGVLSFLTIDRGKFKPLSAELTATLTLVLLYLSLRPLHEDDHWQAHFPAAVAHFLCAWQGLLFFSVYGGPVLLTYCGSTLAVVVMSGVVQSGPSLVARITCFLVVAVWTLYIHAVWRSRQEFAGLSTMLQATDNRPKSNAGPESERLIAEHFKRLPDGAFWSTLTLVIGMTAACVALGVATFFSAPRMDSFLAIFDKRSSATETKSADEIPKFGRGPAVQTTTTSGVGGNGMTVKNLGNITLDSRVAMRAVFSKPAAQLADSKGRILLKGLNYAEYRNGDWIPDTKFETLESRVNVPITYRDPSSDGAVRRGEEIEQKVELIALNSPQFFAGAPLVRVTARAVELDSEGSVRNVGGTNLHDYTLTVSVPNNAEMLTEFSKAEHRQFQRYVRQNGLLPNEREALGQLARQITKSSRSALAKAAAIRSWLENNRNYTTNLERIRPTGDPVVHFLTTTDPEQERGHCGLFASAFVLLCRANDLPARLCTGFAVQIDRNDLQSKSVIAHNSDAHAWAEIYFRGTGWVPFDPTPAAVVSSNDVASSPNTSQPVTKPQSTVATSALVESEPSQGLVQDWWNATLKFNSYEQRKLWEKLSGTAGTGAQNGSSGKGWVGWLGVGLMWAGIAVAIGWLVHIFARRSSRRKYAQTSGGARARAAVGFYNDLLSALSRRGYSRRPGQTPREFAEAVLRRGGEAFAPVREVTDIFEAVRYGGGELEQDEFNRLQEALDKIREMTF